MTSAEPLTPELVLVDPDLARRAREQLPDREPEPRRITREWIPSPATPPMRAVQPSPPTASPATPPIRLVQPSPETFARDLRLPPQKRRRGRVLILLMAAVAATGIALVPSLRHFFWETRGVAVVPTVGEPTVPRGEAHSKPKSPPHETSATPGKAGSKKTVKPKRRTAPRTAPSNRPFAWVAVPKATYYLVRFYRGSQEIFEARPSAPRLSLPPEWVFKGHRYSLTPGSYRWVVQAGFGRPTEARLGQPIVSAKLVV